MLRFNNLLMKQKLIFSILIVLIPAFIILTVISSLVTQSIIREIVLREVKQTAYSYAHSNQIVLEESMTIARTLSHTFSSKRDDLDINRNEVITILKSVLDNNPKILGVWTVWEPNAIDGKDSQHIGQVGSDVSGRFVPYWNRADGVLLEECMDYELKNEQGEYYNRPIRERKEVVMEPITYEIAGRDIMVVSLCVPIIGKDGKVYGVSGVDLSMDFFVESIGKIQPYPKSYAAMMSNNGSFVAHPSPVAIGQIIGDLDNAPDKEYMKSSVRQGKEFMVEKIAYISKNPSFQVFVPFSIGRADTFWSFGIVVDKIQIRNYAMKLIWIQLLLYLLVIIVISFAILFISKMLVTPIYHLVEIFKDLSAGEGDLRKRIPVESTDEIGMVAKYFNLFIEKLHGIVKDIVNINSKLVNEAKEMNTSSDVLAEQASELNLQVDSVSAASDEINTNINIIASSAEQSSVSVNSLADTAHEMSENINTVAVAAEQTSNNVNEVIKSVNDVTDNIDKSSQNMNNILNGINNTASAIEEMSVSIQEISKNTQHASNISEEASKESENAAKSMHELNQIANSIGKIVKVISDIADQTNMLALNATIEAASAGEAGKGFAVVANEVKELAKQTTIATEKISSDIDEVQNATSNAVKTIQKISEIVKDINQVNVTVASSIEEQSITTNEISNSVGLVANQTTQMGKYISEIDDNIKTVNRSMNEAGLAVNQIAESSNSSASSANIVASNSIEASKGVTEIASSIQQISLGMNEINQIVQNLANASNVNNQTSEALKNNSANLEKLTEQLDFLLNKFKV